MSTIEIFAAVLLAVLQTIPFLYFFPRIAAAFWAFLTTLTGDDMEDAEQ